VVVRLEGLVRFVKAIVGRVMQQLSSRLFLQVTTRLPPVMAGTTLRLQMSLTNLKTTSFPLKQISWTWFCLGS
jgi:hypothetical protein